MICALGLQAQLDERQSAHRSRDTSKGRVVFFICNGKRLAGAREELVRTEWITGHRAQQRVCVFP